MEELKLEEDIKQFIQSYIPTAGSLETLLFLFEGSKKAWTAEGIAQELRSNPTMVKDFMSYFQSKGLVLKDGNSCYRLNLEHANLWDRLSRLEKIYKQRPVSVLNEIYRNPGRPGSKIQVFADAFKIKKKE